MSHTIKTDIVLIGAGIMSGTLGVLLKELNPNLSISIFEKLDAVALESSDAWNNAGTGHSAFCELNYTPVKDGKIDITKAIKIASAFEYSKEFWSYLIENKKITAPETFIQKIPHMSFVWGDENVAFLKQRHLLLSNHPLFCDLEYSHYIQTLEEWMPLIMNGRIHDVQSAATRMSIGTDVNFGAVTRSYINFLTALDGVKLFLQHSVNELSKSNGSWKLHITDEANQESITVEAPLVFIGAGGGTLHLLEKSNIPEGRGYGGFPISGQWLICNDKNIIDRHWAKVYGKAEVGAPPMSVPHLDTRFINGERALLFGPFAGFSTKFLKHGSYWDLPSSIELDNIKPMLSAGINNIPLTKYLIDQLRLSHEDRVQALRKYMPLAESQDWQLGIAGQRVQVIKKDDVEGGVLEFGTELVCSDDGSLAALLGASPGASTAVHIMIELIKKGFGKNSIPPGWENKIKEFIPSYGIDFNKNENQVEVSRERTSRILEL